MRFATALLGVFLGTAACARAEVARLEVGASLLGLSVTDYGGTTTTFAGVPATLYASFFAGRRLVLEPQIGFHSMTTSRRSDHLLIGTLQVAWLVRGPLRSSPFVLGDATVARNSYTVDETNYAFGLGVGYRLPLRSLAVRAEFKYRRYLRLGADALSVIVAVGVVL